MLFLMFYQRSLFFSQLFQRSAFFVFCYDSVLVSAALVIGQQRVLDLLLFIRSMLDSANVGVLLPRLVDQRS